MQVAVIILNWNGLSYTKAAIASVQAQTYRDITCVVVDNGSKPDEVGRLRSVAKETGVRVLENGQNVGFCGGNNVGAAWAKEKGIPYLLFLNNDATLAPDAVERLVAAFENPEVGAVSPCIYHAHQRESVWFGSGKVHLSHPTVVTVVPEKPTPDTNGLAATDWVCGCVLLIPTDLYFTVGGFDESLFAYHEDVDLSLRVRVAGKRCVVLSEVSAWHVGGGGTVGQSPHQLYYTTRNAFVVVRRHGTPEEIATFESAMARRVRQLSVGLKLFSVAGMHWDCAPALVLGLLDGKAGVTGSFQERKSPLADASKQLAKQVVWLIPFALLMPKPLRRRLRNRLAVALGLPETDA